jgi:hypothetical protein
VELQDEVFQQFLALFRVVDQFTHGFEYAIGRRR